MINKISGVYKITNNITGDFYIGSSKDIKHRWAHHKCPSTWNSKPNSLLYKTIQKYGLDNFTFEVLEETDNLKEREQYYIEQLSPSYNNIRAKGIDEERAKDYKREWCKAHMDRILEINRAYRSTHREQCNARARSYRNRLCLYKGETITLNTLYHKFYRAGIVHPAQEAKKYIIKGE